MSQPLDVPLLFRAMEDRMEERMNVIMRELARTNDRYDEFKSAAENRIMEMLTQGSGNKDVESKEPEDLNLSEVYEEYEDEVNVSFRVNEELVNASRLAAPNVVDRHASGKTATVKSAKEKDPKRMDRRDSIYRKLDRINSGVNDRVQVYKNTPSFEYLKLNKFDVGAVMSFATGIDQFQSKHHLSVPAATLVSSSARQEFII